MMPARQLLSGETPSSPAVFGVMLANRPTSVQSPVTLRLRKFMPSPSNVVVLPWTLTPEG